MTKLALALATALVFASVSVGTAGAGEGSPDLAVPSKAEYYGQRTDAPSYSGPRTEAPVYYGPRTVAPVAARNSFQAPGQNATVPSFDDAERQWMERASRPYNG